MRHRRAADVDSEIDVLFVPLTEPVPLDGPLTMPLYLLLSQPPQASREDDART